MKGSLLILAVAFSLIILLAGCAGSQPGNPQTPAAPPVTQPTNPQPQPTEPVAASPEIPNPPETYKGGQINIKSDDEFTAANGVVGGSGTPADPYIIEGWAIDASSFNTGVETGSTYGISIFETSKYFVIRNCRVKNAGGHQPGIKFNFVSNGKIENCTLTNNSEGIWIDGSYNVIISGNTIENCNTGISVDFHSSDNVTVSNNIITNATGAGIFFNAATNSYALNNTIRNKEGYGIRLGSSMNCTISNNIVQGNENEEMNDGIEVSESGWEGGDNNIISNNDVSGNGGIGIRVSGSYDIISHNTANGNGGGIYLEDIGLTDISAGHNIVSNNTASNNRRNGFSVDVYCAGNTITYNTFVSNNVDNEYFSDKSPRWYDMYINNKNNVFKDNTYGTILMTPSAR